MKLCPLCATLLRPQVLEETEHFRHWRQQKVAKIVQCGEQLSLMIESHREERDRYRRITVNARSLIRCGIASVDPLESIIVVATPFKSDLFPSGVK